MDTFIIGSFLISLFIFIFIEWYEGGNIDLSKFCGMFVVSIIPFLNITIALTISVIFLSKRHSFIILKGRQNAKK